MKKLILSLLFITTLSMLLLCSCSSKKQSSLSALCENLRSDYNAKISFTVSGLNGPVEGACELSHEKALTKLKIISPELLSGMTVEYDISGAPSSVAVRFKDFDADFPENSLSKINAIARLTVDDFISTLSKVADDKIIECEISDEERGYIVNVPYGDAEITVCYSNDGSMPYSMEYTSKQVNASVIFSSFELTVTDLTPKSDGV